MGEWMVEEYSESEKQGLLSKIKEYTRKAALGLTFAAALYSGSQAQAQVMDPDPQPAPIEQEEVTKDNLEQTIFSLLDKKVKERQEEHLGFIPVVTEDGFTYRIKEDQESFYLTITNDNGVEQGKLYVNKKTDSWVYTPKDQDGIVKTNVGESDKAEDMLSRLLGGEPEEPQKEKPKEPSVQKPTRELETGSRHEESRGIRTYSPAENLENDTVRIQGGMGFGDSSGPVVKAQALTFIGPDSKLGADLNYPDLEIDNDFEGTRTDISTILGIEKNNTGSLRLNFSNSEEDKEKDYSRTSTTNNATQNTTTQTTGTESVDDEETLASLLSGIDIGQGWYLNLGAGQTTNEEKTRVTQTDVITGTMTIPGFGTVPVNQTVNTDTTVTTESEFTTGILGLEKKLREGSLGLIGRYRSQELETDQDGTSLTSQDLSYWNLQAMYQARNFRIYAGSQFGSDIDNELVGEIQIGLTDGEILQAMPRLGRDGNGNFYGGLVFGASPEGINEKAKKAFNEYGAFLHDNDLDLGLSADQRWDAQMNSIERLQREQGGFVASALVEKYRDELRARYRMSFPLFGTTITAGGSYHPDEKTEHIRVLRFFDEEVYLVVEGNHQSNDLSDEDSSQIMVGIGGGF